jgi:hypothetical protein
MPIESIDIPEGYFSGHGSISRGTEGDKDIGHLALILQRLIDDVRYVEGIAADLYQNATPIPQNHGGVEIGDNLFGLNMTEMFDRVLRPYEYPVFTSFGIQGQSNLEIGDQIPASVSFTWGLSNQHNVVEDSLVIRDVTRAEDLATGVQKTPPEAVVMPSGAIQKTSQASHVFRISGQNNKPGSITPRNATYYWYWRLFYGVNINATLDEAAIEALVSSMLTGAYARTYALGGGSNYKYVCFPTSFGTPSTFIDTDTGFGVDMVKQAPDVNVTNGFGQTTAYSIWRTLNTINSTLNLQVN